ncbi:MAG: hypothetical protein WCI60_02780 [bacterium]|jgi:hypothetical protein
MVDSIKKSKQKIYREIILGILLYSVVLGFFNDYTNILHTGTYSVTFAVAIVMEILTYLTFLLKDLIVTWFKDKEGKIYRYAMFFSVWLVLFLSKFVFLEVIAIVFRSEVKISGFVGLLIIVICLTAAEKIVNLIDKRLG